MTSGKFAKLAADESNPRYNEMIARVEPLYRRENEIRSEFARDYTRIIHCSGYRRLKHKTQVFFSPQSDHICTRIEHVNHVESISGTIAKFLGLNTELTRAISVAHDLGHAPFGHKGERVLSEILENDCGVKFWHEKNGIHFVDDLELLEDEEHTRRNLDLTYAVRDGIISHCGEVDMNGLFPRQEAFDLSEYKSPNQFAPFTFEGCIVKIADKISYIGRDIEDALKLNILDESDLKELAEISDMRKTGRPNNTMLINTFIGDICENSSPEKGIAFSAECFEALSNIRHFNTDHIYRNKRLHPSDKYFELVIKEIYNIFKEAYDGKNTFKKLDELSAYYKNAAPKFKRWLSCYADVDERDKYLKNKIVYRLDDKAGYCHAVVDYISGMSDQYAIDTYEDIISF